MSTSPHCKKDACTVYLHGKGLNDTREHNVDFAVKNKLLGMIQPKRIWKTSLAPSSNVWQPHQRVCIASQTCSYRNTCRCWVSSTQGWVPTTQPGQSARGIICGFWKINENVQWLLEVCTHFNLSIINSFQAKPQYKTSWRRNMNASSQRDGIFREYDVILCVIETSRRLRLLVLSKVVYRGILLLAVIKHGSWHIARLLNRVWCCVRTDPGEWFFGFPSKDIEPN